MNVLEKRPLCLILCIMLAAFSLFIGCNWIIRFIGVGISVVLFIITFLFKDIFRGRESFFRICSIASILTILLSGLAEYSFAPYEYTGKDVKVEGLVVEVEEISSTSRSVTFQTSKINDKTASYKAIFYNYDFDVFGMESGDYISFNADVERLGQDEDGIYGDSYYLSRGYSYRFKGVEGIAFIEKRALEFDLIKEFRNRLSEKLIELTEPSTGGLLAALILGDQDYLDGPTKLNFSLIGITHILALSGAHLVMLSEALKRILNLCGLNKKAVYFSTTIFSILYTILTGCSASIVRAMVMLIVNNTLFMFERPHDSYTTIPLAVSFIILFDPRSVFDLGLWLSAFATLGLVFYANTQANRVTPEGWVGKIGVFIKDSLFSTLFAIGSTVLICVLNFEYISLLSPITTLIFSYPITLVIYGGVIMLFLPFQTPLSYLVAYITSLIQLGADWFASLDFAIISTQFASVVVLSAVFTFAFFFLLVINTKNRRAVAITLAIAISAPFLAGFIETASVRNWDSFEFVYEEKSDRILYKSKNEISLVYNGSMQIEDADKETDELEYEHIVYVDKLIFTCYDKPLASFIYRFISSIKTDLIYLPKPDTLKEAEIAAEISAILSRCSTTLVLYDIGEAVNIGGATLKLRARHGFGGYNASQVVYDLSTKDKTYTYFSLGVFQLMGYEATEMFMNSEVVIFGSYGGKYISDVIIDVITPGIKEIYLTPKVTLVRAAYDYYIEKGAVIHEITAPSILFIH